MKTKSLMIGAAMAALSFTAMALPAANAKTGETGHEAAIEACSAVNPYQPVELSGAIDDGSGIGFSLVWLTDAEEKLWMCDADSEGYIYSYTEVAEDLLAGYGPELIGLALTSDGGYEDQPQAVAEKVCAAYLTEGGTVLASGSDGLSFDPGYAVFVENASGDLYLCNATGDAMVWAFEPIGDPINLENDAAVS